MANKLRKSFAVPLKGKTHEQIVNYIMMWLKDLDSRAGKFEFVVVEELPEASEQTKGKIYFVPTTDPAAGNQSDEYVTVMSGDDYVWEKIGSSTLDPAAVIERIGLLEAAIVEKANKDGYYQTLTSGASENLVGRGSVPASFTRRTSGGSADIGNGFAIITKLKGNTLAWNQMLKLAETKVWLRANSTGEFSEDGKTASFTATAQYGQLMTNSIKWVEGHKYLLSCDVSLAEDDSLQIYAGEDVTTIINFLGNPLSSAGDYSIREIKTARASSSNPCPVIFQNNSASDWGEVVVKNAMMFDLTEMFGSGNEPTAAAEFKALFPLSYYAYNKREIINFNSEALATIGFNAYNPATGKAFVLGGHEYQISGTYTALTLNGDTVSPDIDGLFTPAADGELVVTGGNDTDTCVHLTWSGYRNGEYETYWKHALALDIAAMESDDVAVFPTGMKKLGSVADEAVIDNDGYIRKVVKKIGSVDAGTLTWDYVAPSEGAPYGYFVATIADRKANSANVLCGKYPTVNTFNADKIIRSGGYVIVVDSDYSTAESFTEAMSGVTILYDLAEPVEYTLDTPVYANYKVDDFGTEEITPANTDEPVTAPCNIEVKYPMNAVDILRNLDKNYISAASMDAFLAEMKTKGIVADYTMTYNATTHKYDFVLTAPSTVTPEQQEE